MNGQQLEAKLRNAEFMINQVEHYDHQSCFRLGCGAVITLFKTGTCVVQGKFIKSCKNESREILGKILPLKTRWQI